MLGKRNNIEEQEGTSMIPPKTSKYHKGKLIRSEDQGLTDLHNTHLRNASGGSYPNKSPASSYGKTQQTNTLKPSSN